LNFVGAGVTVTDDAGNDQTDVTIPGGGFTEEEVRDIVGDMFNANIESGIVATYDDPAGKIDLVVNKISLSDFYNLY
jgi:hypothetical protein